MPRSAFVGGLAKRGVIPQKQFYIKLFIYNTVILAHWIEQFQRLTTLNAQVIGKAPGKPAVRLLPGYRLDNGTLRKLASTISPAIL